MVFERFLESRRAVLKPSWDRLGGFPIRGGFWKHFGLLSGCTCLVLFRLASISAVLERRGRSNKIRVWSGSGPGLVFKSGSGHRRGPSTGTRTNTNTIYMIPCWRCRSRYDNLRCRGGLVASDMTMLGCHVCLVNRDLTFYGCHVSRVARGISISGCHVGYLPRDVTIYGCYVGGVHGDMRLFGCHGDSVARYMTILNLTSYWNGFAS